MTHGAVGIIPARYGSTRLPGKLLEDLGGRPVIGHVIDHLRAAKRVDTTVVATDDERIADAARVAGADVVMSRGSHETGTDRVGEAARDLGVGDRVIVNVQGDEPFLDSSAIDACVEMASGRSTWDITTLATRCGPDDVRDPNVVKVVTAADGRALYFSRSAIPWSETDSQDALRHIGIYAFRPGALEAFLGLPWGRLEKVERLEQLRALEGGLSIGVGVGDYPVVGIDTREDLERARALLRAR